MITTQQADEIVHIICNIELPVICKNSLNSFKSNPLNMLHSVLYSRKIYTDKTKTIMYVVSFYSFLCSTIKFVKI